MIERNDEKIPKAPRLQLSSANIDRHGVYIMDQGENMYLMVGGAVSDTFCQEVFEVPNFMSIPEGLVSSLFVVVVGCGFFFCILMVEFGLICLKRSCL